MTKVFLSHAAFDSDLAMYLKAILEEHLKGIEVFCSDDPTDLPPGSKWATEVQTALNESDILLLLATSRGLSRNWVWFECGGFWFNKGKEKLIPLCLGQVRKGALPLPLSERMALNIDDPTDLDNLFRTLEDLTSTKREPMDIPTIASTLQDKEKTISERILKEIVGWIGAVWNGKFLSYEGPIEGLELIEDGIHQQSMSDALTSAGFKVRLGMPHRLSAHAEKGYRIVYLTDRQSWRRRISSGENVLIAKPNSI